MATEANTLIQERFARHRLVTGAPVVPDAAQSKAHVLGTRGYETILVVPIIGGGAAPTAEITPYLYDADKDAFYPHVASGALSSGQVIEIAAMGYKIFLGLTAVAGAPTSVEILVGPGRRSRWPEE